MKCDRIPLDGGTHLVVLAEVLLESGQVKGSGTIVEDAKPGAGQVRGQGCGGGRRRRRKSCGVRNREGRRRGRKDSKKERK